jgi:predicted ATPase/class 3 adenylate cyclase
MASNTPVAPPTGEVALLFTDIEGSTLLVQQLGATWDAVLHEHYRILRAVWTTHGGYEVSTDGDSFFVAFATARDAVAAAVAGQDALAAHDWAPGITVRVRMGIHVGPARHYEGDYVGLTVHEAARVQSAAHGGQVLVSERVRDDAEAAGVGDLYFIDRGLHRLKDLASPMRIYQAAGPGLEVDFPRLRTLTAMPNNFPVQLTGFVGRTDDIDTLSGLMGVERLITLVGAGGVGKTRLALELGAELLERYPDGAWIVDLAGLADARLVPNAAAAAVGVKEQVNRPVSDTLTDHLAARTTLIVLDNCEHLIDACAELAERLVVSCRNVTVLATSREALNVPGEVTYRLRSLERPEPSADLDALGRIESVTLFVQRAASGRPGFELTADNADAVVQICRRLDGVPLAIELAAARVRVMAVREIAAHLDDRFRLLTGGARTALPRQRTLEATVAWSYDLLTDLERVAFGRLSVFAGGFSLDAAREVCSDGSLAADDVVTTITQLCERSMVVYDDDGGPVARYGLLETLRQFGRDRLIERGDGPSVRDRHLAWAVAFAESAPQQTGPHPHEEVRRERDNLRAALEWALERGDEVSALRITGSVWVGHFQEQRRVFDRLLPLSERVPPYLGAKVAFGALGLAFMMGDWQLGVERAAMAADVARRAGDDQRLSMSITYRGLCEWGLGRDDDALRSMQEGLEVADDTGIVDAGARAACFEAWWWTERDLERAASAADGARNRAHLDGVETFTQGHIEEVVAFVTCLREDADAGARQLADATATFKHIQLSCGAHILETCAAWAAMTARFELGAELLGAAERIRDETADRPRPWERAVRRDWLPRIEDALELRVLRDAKARGRRLEFLDALDFAALELRAATD